MFDVETGQEKIKHDHDMLKCCISCGGTLGLFYSPFSKLMVASDAQPFFERADIYQCQQCHLVQKIPDADYIRNIDIVYENYSIAGISDGKDAMVGEISRSAAVIEKIITLLPESGSILDVGTGSGAFLRAAEEHTRLDLYAHDINDNHGEYIQRINVAGTFICELEDINSKFDIISAIHVAEHIIDTEDFYPQIRRLLKSEGIFVVQVPQSNINEFDLLVYDHVLHFSYATLQQLLKKYFRYCIPVPNIYKQVTLLATDNPELIKNVDTSDYPIPDFEGSPDVKRVDNLINECQKASKIMIFGTGPVSVYFAQLFHDKTACFIDDDSCKHGKELIGIEVRAPENKIADLPLLVPFPIKQATQIASRWTDHDIIL